MESLVSIVMPVFNTEDFLADSIMGILHQDYSRWELLLILDGGQEVANAYDWKRRFPDPRIRWLISKRNRGLSRSRNLAMRCAKGSWIAFCDSDDVWRPNKLTIQLQIAQQGNYNILGSCFAFSQKRMGVGSGNMALEYLKRSVLPRKLDYQTLLKTNALPMSSAMYNNDELGKRYFDSTLGKRYIHEDYAYWLEFLSNQEARPHLVHQPLLRIRLRNNSRSSDKFAAIKSHAWILMGHLGLVHRSRVYAIYYLIHYMFWALIKRSRRWQLLNEFDWNR